MREHGAGCPRSEAPVRAAIRGAGPVEVQLAYSFLTALMDKEASFDIHKGPHAMNQDLKNRIRERAYEIWITRGRLDEQADQHGRPPSEKSLRPNSPKRRKRSARRYGVSRRRVRGSLGPVPCWRVETSYQIVLQRALGGSGQATAPASRSSLARLNPHCHQLWGAPMVSAISAPRAPMGCSGPVVVSRAV